MDPFFSLAAYPELGTALIQFVKPEDAREAIAELTAKPLFGVTQIRVDWAEEQPVDSREMDRAEESDARENGHKPAGVASPLTAIADDKSSSPFSTLSSSFQSHDNIFDASESSKPSRFPRREKELKVVNDQPVLRSTTGKRGGVESETNEVNLFGVTKKVIKLNKSSSTPPPPHNETSNGSGVYRSNNGINHRQTSNGNSYGHDNGNGNGNGIERAVMRSDPNRHSSVTVTFNGLNSIPSSSLGSSSSLSLPSSSSFSPSPFSFSFPFSVSSCPSCDEIDII